MNITPVMHALYITVKMELIVSYFIGHETDTHTTLDVCNSFKLPNHTCLLEFTARILSRPHLLIS